MVSALEPRGPARIPCSDNAQSLWYQGPVHPSLFDPPPEAPDYNELHWQNVTELKVIASKDCPDGRWYFKSMNRQSLTAVDGPSDEPEATISQQLPPGYSENTRETKVADKFFYNYHEPLRPSGVEVFE